VKTPRLEKIMQFRTSFLKMITKTARNIHVQYIFKTARSPDGKKFKKLTRKYAVEKADKYNSTKANLSASGLMFEQLQPQKPQKIGGGGSGRSNIILTYGIKSSAMHPRNKGTIPTGELMNLHQNGTSNMPARDIAGEKTLPDIARDTIVKLLVNQIDKNIKDALHPGKTTETL
tara:strand:+ start:518 stop:1039 length:522 start_codon:yes stop_codon:yes gene_type:complete